MLRFQLIFIVFSLLFFFSCSKDKDEQKPIVTITSPVYMQSINGFDTIIVRGTVTDNVNIKSISISLKDNNNIPALSTIYLNPNVTNFEVNELFIFDDVHLASGIYYFDIKASDGENITSEYVEVSVSGVPITRDGIFIFDNVSNNTSIYKLDNNYNASFFTMLYGDFLGGAANSYFQQVISVGSATGKATALDASFADELWSLSLVNSPPTPYFTNVFFNDKTIYLGYRNGDVKGFGSNGVPNFSAKSTSGYYAESGFIHGDYMVTEQVSIAFNQVSLGMYWLASGALYQQLLINENICGMFSFNSNEIVLLTNDASNNGKLSFFNISASGINSPFSIGTGKIDACEEVGNGIYLFARNGDIRLVNVHNFTTQLYLLGVNANQIKYDEFTNELFVVSGNTLTVYDYSSRVVIGTYTHENPILDVEFLYNK